MHIVTSNQRALHLLLCDRASSRATDHCSTYRQEAEHERHPSDSQPLGKGAVHFTALARACSAFQPEDRAARPGPTAHLNSMQTRAIDQPNSRLHAARTTSR